MGRYLAQRVVAALFVIWLVATLVFFLLRLVPGDPLGAMLADVDPTAAAALRQKLGLDRPLPVQYLLWLRQLVQGDMGSSIYGSNVPVSQIILEALPRTLSLASLSLLIALTLALSAGLISAVKKYSWMDHAFTTAAFLGLSMPDFWLGILLIIIFAVNLRVLPAIGYEPLSAGFWPWFSHLILPAIASGNTFAAVIARMVRS
jgi:peptide/nickel transport system permease protein